MYIKHVLRTLGTFALLGIIAVVALALVVGRESVQANELVSAACAEAQPGMNVDEFIELASQYETLSVRDGREAAERDEDYVVELMQGSFRLNVICVGEFSSRGQLIQASVERIE